MRHNLHFAKGAKFVHKKHILTALHSKHHAHKVGHGTAAVKKNINAFNPAGTGEGIHKKHVAHKGKRLAPLKFKF